MIGIGKWIFKLVENSVIPIISQEQEAHYRKIICAIYICNETERDKNAHSMCNNRVKSLLISIYPRTIRVIKEGSICGIELCVGQ